MMGKSISAAVLVGALAVAVWAQAPAGAKPGEKAKGNPTPAASTKPAEKAKTSPASASNAKPAPQGSTAKPTMAPGSKAAPVTPALAKSPAGTAAKPPAKPVAAALKSAVKSPVQKAKAAAPKKTVAKVAAKPAEPEAPEDVADFRSVTAQGRRDPFHSVLQNRNQGHPDCTTGKKCLVADEIQLRGVVKAPQGMLAVVETTQNKTYFLREKDPIYNGQVLRITGDSVVFRETVRDRAGRAHTREVVKRIPGGKPA